MPSSKPEPQYIIDCHGLEFYAHTRNNAVRAMLTEMFENGTLKVPSKVWQDFREAYEDEAEPFKLFVQVIKTRPAHRAKAGVIASKANSGFRVEPYGNSDWYAGAVAETDSCTLITVDAKKQFYSKLLNCAVVSITDFAEFFA